MRPFVHLSTIALLACSWASAFSYSAEQVEPALKLTDDLSEEVWQLRGEHQPLTDERFAPVRAELRQRAEVLSRVIDSTNTPDRWRSYLRWKLLEPHFSDDVTINRQTLEELDSVLRRFHTNMPGLELPSFRRTAEALKRYRELAFWNALAKRRDTAPIYDSYVKQLQKQLERHLEAPTDETAHSVAKAVRMIDYQGTAPELVGKLRSRFSRSNVQAELSVDALNRLAQPVTEREDVNDCILGARVRGEAMVDGQVRFAAVQSHDRTRMDIQLTGHISTSTVGYKKPVKIYSRGTTAYHGTKSLLIADDYFRSTAAHVSANTNNRPYRVRKTGGKFGRRLVQKIAWKQVCKKKRQSERIASSKASKKVSKKFDERVSTALVEGRDKYEEKLQLPLVRRGFEPSQIRFASTSTALTTAYALGTGDQLTTDTLPPGKDVTNDITVQVHQSAVNNFLPLVLSGVTMVRDSIEEPQRLEGDAPKWLTNLNAANESRELSLAEPSEEEDFKPYRLVFNSERPASVSFDDGIASIRLRFASLVSGEDEEQKPIENWDFIVHYRVTERDNRVVLVRDGEVEVFPTGFDPRWDKKMSGEQVGFRNNLAANLNKKADQEQGFPSEIEVPEIKLGNQGGAQRKLAIQQLECDEGWLTIGYRMP